MSSIEKLKIVGIRSFSPHAENVIEFHTPLTIIVGHNGAGKTTIIECLKYATTGEMPPNAKGGAFVHDPKVSRETDVKAQIKLKFRNTRQQVMVVTRSMQLTQTKAKLTLKTLESLLATVDPNTGEQVSISSRCAQLDSEMPFHLGVSRAVLQNVIFCHQEDSLWPLSESSVLKKKFDEIFAADKYTKALDTLRSVRKQLMQDQKVEEERLASLKDRRDLALRLEADLRTADERIAETTARVAALERAIGESERRLGALQNDLERFAVLQGDYERVQHELQLADQSVSDLRLTVTPMSESDEALRLLLQQHEERVRDAASSRSRLTADKERAAGAMAALEGQHSHCLSERGQIWAEQGILEKRAFDLEIAEDELARSLGLPSGNVLEGARAKIGQMQARFTALQLERRDRDTRAIEAIQALLGESNALTESKRSKRGQADEARERLVSVLGLLAATETSAGKTADLEVLVGQAERDYTSLLQQVSQASYESRLDALVSQRQSLEQQSRKATAELAQLGRFADARARLDVQRAEAARKESAVGLKWAEAEPALREMGLGHGQADSADHLVEEELKASELSVKELSQRLESAKATSASSRSRSEHIRDALAKCQAELRAKRTRLDASCDDGLVLSDLIAQAEDELSTVTRSLVLSQSSKATYEAFQRTLGDSHACPLCERGFENGSSEQALSHKLAGLLASLPQAVLDSEQRKRALQGRLSELVLLRPVFDDVERLRTREVPELSAALRQAEEEAERTFLQVEDLQSELSTLRLRERRLVALRRATEELSRLLRDASGARAEAQKMERETAGPGKENVSPEQLQVTASRLQSELFTVQSDQENLSSEMKARQSELQAREAAFRDAKEGLLQAQLAGAEQKRLSQRKDELESVLRVLEQEIQSVTDALAPLAGQIQSLHVTRDGMRAEASSLEAESRSLLEKALALLTKADGLHADLADRHKLDGSLASVNGRISDLERQKLELKSAIADLEAQISMYDRAEGETLLRERTLRDNLGLRVQQRRAEELRSRMAAFGPLPVADRAAVQEAFSRQQRSHASVLGDRAGLQGELRQLEDQAARHRADLERSYPDYEQAYRSQVVRVRASAAGIDDLERYARALDQAIMRYHGHKMDELNRQLRELWTATYRGADIDTIAIRAAHATEGAARTYNYRVVMLKGGDTELDMRGRSSAGQRVLASLIIRLALAETFGQACGILALDEPTTNLDRDNIEALAAALADIIRVRRQQANFQLVIITHDEEFVEMLGRYECADYYYRVFKDDGQFSTIEQQSILR